MKTLIADQLEDVTGGWFSFGKKKKKKKESNDSGSSNDGLTKKEAKELCDKVGDAADKTVYKDAKVEDACKQGVDNVDKLNNKSKNYLESIGL